MALINDQTGFFSQIKNHDHVITWCAIWADHYNMMASFPWNTEAEKMQLEEEMSQYICYDV